MKGKTKSTLLTHTIQVKVTRVEYEAMKLAAQNMSTSMSDAARTVLTEHYDRDVVVITVWPDTARAFGLVGGKEVEYLGDTLVRFKMPAKHSGIRVTQVGITIVITKYGEEIYATDIMAGDDSEGSVRWSILHEGLDAARAEIEKYGVLSEAK